MALIALTLRNFFSASPRESFSMEMSATGLQVFFNDRLPTCLNMKTAVFLRHILYSVRVIYSLNVNFCRQGHTKTRSLNISSSEWLIHHFIFSKHLRIASLYTKRSVDFLKGFLLPLDRQSMCTCL